MTTAEYWQGLQFTCISTYSFNRGPKLQSWQQAAEDEYRLVRSSLLSSTGEQLAKLRQRLRQLESAVYVDLLSRPLLDEGGAFHITASPVAVLGTDAQAEVGQLLRQPVVEQFDFMCAPTYRDALVFHNQHGDIVDVLSICFECERMLAGINQEIQADHSVYVDMKVLLGRLGHEIKDNEYGTSRR